jgi:methyl-accepting chemotaxis protein
LSKASEKIGEIINLINEIATQTNLLSLNASIEAARAGESGRGFAIVASEVKNLADQTSIATKEISSQVKSVQNFTQKAVGDMEEIFSSIKTLSEISSVISSAVEEQSLVTKEMAINMTMAAENVETINSSISNISEATNRIKEVAKKVKEASNGIV